MKIGIGKCHNNSTHPIQIFNPKITRTAISGTRGLNITAFDTRFNRIQPTVWSLFFHLSILTYLPNLANRLFSK